VHSQTSPLRSTCTIHRINTQCKHLLTTSTTHADVCSSELCRNTPGTRVPPSSELLQPKEHLASPAALLLCWTLSCSRLRACIAHSLRTPRRPRPQTVASLSPPLRPCPPSQPLALQYASNAMRPLRRAQLVRPHTQRHHERAV
jgi:hypothetical protein